MQTKLAVTCASLVLLSTATAAADDYVQGYYCSNGTCVQPTYRTRPDGNPNNNYSTSGNVNPYTGQPGTKAPDQRVATSPSFMNPQPEQPDPNRSSLY